nr:cytochrome P450 [Gordonia crocea]
MAADRAHCDIDISTERFWRQPFAAREEAFAALRARPGITWHAPLDVPFPHEEKGFWAVTRHADIAHVSTHHDLFCSGQGIGLGPIPVEFEQMMSFFLAMDPPEHTTYRRIIGAAFTPKQVRKVDEVIAANARDIVDAVVGAGEFDFVERVAALLPMHTVSDMVGVPRSERDAVTEAAGSIIGADLDTSEEAITRMFENIQYLHSMGADLAEHRRKHPADDLMTSIVQAEVDGQRLTNEQIGAFMILLSTAGNDTTKQTSAHVIKALADHPDQKAWLTEDFDGRIKQSIEEFVRYATPVMDFARHATRDTVIGDQPIAQGEKVAIFYCSGNRDETVFAEPDRFDLTRWPNPHQGFGGGGIHYCLGHFVAKIQLRCLFSELLTKLPDLEVGEPVYLSSNFVNGITSLPVRA